MHIDMHEIYKLFKRAGSNVYSVFRELRLCECRPANDLCISYEQMCLLMTLQK
jgi:hypothetical protein